ncbi:hypothetical protein PPUN15366_32750 [Pseudomonas putida]|nr:hypothetical protein PPUN15366_32750 [Pseudomonas putida]
MKMNGISRRVMRRYSALRWVSVPWSGAGLYAMIGFSVVMVVAASPVPALALTSLGDCGVPVFVLLHSTCTGLLCPSPKP